MNKRTYGLGALAIVVCVASIAYAQEPQRFRQPVEILISRLFLATNVTMQMEGTTNDALEVTLRAPNPDASWTLTLPVTAGSNGQQLTTNGSGVTSWAAASSTRETKDIAGRMRPEDALDAVLRAPLYRFHYKAGAGTGDTKTEYVGIMADESPYFMHYDGKILNPVNGLGYTVGAIQAMQAQIDALKAELAARKE